MDYFLYRCRRIREMEPDPPNPKRGLTLREAEPVLGLKRARLMQLIRAGELKATKELAAVGGSRLVISPDEIKRFREARTKAAQGGERGRGRPQKVPGAEKTESDV